jgi:hypothetical protein
MNKLAFIALDPAAFAGSLEYVPGPNLPRNNKAELELLITKRLLLGLSQPQGVEFGNLQSNPNDPPDVTFTLNGALHGIELCELLPENRLETDAIVIKLRKSILNGLVLGEHTAGLVVTVSLFDDDAGKLRPGRIAPTLADALNQFFSAGYKEGLVPIPESVRCAVRSIRVFHEPLNKGDSRLEDERHPLILFQAQNTMIVPETDCALIAEKQLRRKVLHDLSCPTWLVLWTVHFALSQFREELDNAILGYLRSNRVRFDRVFHIHANAVTEFRPGGLVEAQNT